MKHNTYIIQDNKWTLTPFEDISPLLKTITLYEDNCKDIKGIGFY